MKRLTCEMCGGTDLIKQDGVFVCQNCGTKYSVEEAKKLMVEGTVEVKGTVDVKGTVSIDSSKDLKNLYQAARNAREAGDAASAIKQYENISAIDPNSWEAMFYLVLLKTNTIKNGEIENAAISIANYVPKVLSLISSEIDEEKEKKEAVKEVINECYGRARGLKNASKNFCDSLNSGKGISAITGAAIGGLAGGLSVASDLLSSGNNVGEHKDRCRMIMSIMNVCGESIEKFFDSTDSDYKRYISLSYQCALMLGAEILSDDEKIPYQNKIDKYDPPTEDEINERIDSKKLELYKAKKAKRTSQICLIGVIVGALVIIGIFTNGFTGGLGMTIGMWTFVMTSPLWIMAIYKIVKNNKLILKIQGEIYEIESKK